MTFNETFNADIEVNGKCDKSTLGAVFDVLEFELDAWLKKLGLARTNLRLEDKHIFGTGSSHSDTADSSRDEESRGRLLDIIFVHSQRFSGKAAPDLLYASGNMFMDIPIEDESGDWEYGSLLIVTDLHEDDTTLEHRTV